MNKQNLEETQRKVKEYEESNQGQIVEYNTEKKREEEAVCSSFNLFRV